MALRVATFLVFSRNVAALLVKCLLKGFGIANLRCDIRRWLRLFREGGRFVESETVRKSSIVN